MAAKSTPAVAVTAANLISDSAVPHVVNWLTAIYLLLMISHKAWTMFREFHAAEREAAWVMRKKDRRARPRDNHEKEEPE